MIKEQRQQRILSILRTQHMLSITELTRAVPDVSQVTLRRDIAELAEAGALKRTRGGAVLPDAEALSRSPSAPRPADGARPAAGALTSIVDGVDAIVLPPIGGPGGAALRRQVRRRGLPFLAESAPQDGGVYLGPANRAAGRDLGRVAGRDIEGDTATILLIGLADLPNTRERCIGFEEGVRETFAGVVHVISVNGQGSYRSALRVAREALDTNPEIDVIFGVNDHSAIAGRDAAADAGAKATIYATGGERAEFVAEVANYPQIRAIAAFFPEVVGAVAIDAIAANLSGRDLPDALVTPHRIIDRDNLEGTYVLTDGEWTLREDVRVALVNDLAPPSAPLARRPRIGFLPHYPAHDWYRNMIQAMQARCQTLNCELVIAPPHQGIAAEISRLRRDIAQAACERIGPGRTIIIGEGEAGLALAAKLRAIAFDDPPKVAGLTIITNSLDVLERLQDAPGMRTLLTSGEYQKGDRCLVGPSLGALFERLRADAAFLSVGGISPKFGISSPDERLALVGSRFVDAARRVIVMADHMLIGADANHRIARIEAVDEVITDADALPADRLALRGLGIDVWIAGEARPDDFAPRADAFAAAAHP